MKDKFKFKGLENRIPKENTKISIIHIRIKLKKIFEKIKLIGENGETNSPSRQFDLLSCWKIFDIIKIIEKKRIIQIWITKTVKGI